MIVVEVIAIVAFVGGFLSVLVGAWYMATSGELIPIPTQREMVNRIPARVRKAQNLFGAVFIVCVFAGLIIRFLDGKLN